jgi:hypothetical protein
MVVEGKTNDKNQRKDKEPKIFFYEIKILKIMNCNEKERNDKPQPSYQKLQRNTWHSAGNTGEQDPEYI